jgi:hypothetical protein
MSAALFEQTTPSASPAPVACAAAATAARDRKSGRDKRAGATWNARDWRGHQPRRGRAGARFRWPPKRRATHENSVQGRGPGAADGGTPSPAAQRRRTRDRGDCGGVRDQRGAVLVPGSDGRGRQQAAPGVLRRRIGTGAVGPCFDWPRRRVLSSRGRTNRTRRRGYHSPGKSAKGRTTVVRAWAPGPRSTPVDRSRLRHYEGRSEPRTGRAKECSGEKRQQNTDARRRRGRSAPPGQIPDEA